VHDVLPDVSLEPAPQWQAPPQWQPDNIIVSDRRLHKLHEQEGD